MFANNATWTAERIELLKSSFEAGLSCREIARDIGVSRNAVIGKISRLGLSRPKRAGASGRERHGGPKNRRPRIAGQRYILMALRAEPLPADDVPIHNGHCCSLHELSGETCRWPIGFPGDADFRFCGNHPVKGLPYCAGHARIAYRNHDDGARHGRLVAPSTSSESIGIVPPEAVMSGAA